jgi:YHS domain-containing protein
MKNVLVAAIFGLSLAACTPAAEAPAEQETAQADAAVNVIADLGGEPSGPIYTENKDDVVAVSGYDTVSYFQGDGVPVLGLAEFAVKYQGYEYHFANAENAETFIEDPDKYAPQYGGYCAWAIGENDALAPGDAQVYQIVDGKLYLNFNEQVQENWRKDIPGFIEKADANYPAHSPDEHYKG